MIRQQMHLSYPNAVSYEASYGLEDEPQAVNKCRGKNWVGPPVKKASIPEEWLKVVMGPPVT